MAYGAMRLLFSLVLLKFYQSEANNAAYKKQVSASKTCGSPLEYYHSVDQKIISPRRRELFTCDASDPKYAHPPSHMVDENTTTFWQSTASLDTANITIDLRGPHRKFYYAYEIEIQFGLYFRPGKLAYLKSTDGGETFEPWHYYVSYYTADKPTIAEQCRSFGVVAKNRPASVNDVLCMTFPKPTLDPEVWNEKVSLPLTGQRGDISENGQGPSLQLLEWMNVTHVKLQFFNLYRLFDPFAVRWHHYDVREVRVNTFCDCNGHGNQNSCPYDPAKRDRVCECFIGSCGENCDRCCPGYRQYPWKSGTKGPFIADKSAACEACNCHNHSSVCVYNETVALMRKSLDIYGNYSGGGVCQDCKNHTTGINCEKCVKYYYRPRGVNKTDEHACHDCACHKAGTKNATLPGVAYLDCVRDEDEIPSSHPHLSPGDCFCKNNTHGRQCGDCKPGFFNLSGENPLGCQDCMCYQPGTVNSSNNCQPDMTGQCPCKENVQGVKCDTCNDTFYDLQLGDSKGCKECDCDVGGALNAVCNKNSEGQCPCVSHVTGRQCNRPVDGYYFPFVNYIGSTGIQTNLMWFAAFAIPSVSNSSAIFRLVLRYKASVSVTVNITVSSTRKKLIHEVVLPSCQSTCFKHLTEFGDLMLTGSVAVNITFKESQGALMLEKISTVPREFYNPTVLGNDSVVNFLANCSVFENAAAKNASSENYCQNKVFSITMAYLQTALACECNTIGSYNNNCTKYGGQCHCKPGVRGRKCDKCIPQFYNLTNSGCTECNCYGDSKICDDITGQCKCPPNTIGRTCDKCNFSFWDLNPSAGCQSCNCSNIGSKTLQCNLTTGNCSCKPGVTGNKCSHCDLGYKDFSMAGCTFCGCDMNGSLSEVCDNSTGQCPCKNKSEGITCSQCKAGHFYLNKANPAGCSRCVCMGITTNCSSTSMYKYKRQDRLSDWFLDDNSTMLQTSVLSVFEGGNQLRLISANVTTGRLLYWKATSNYTRKSMVGAYGGYFSFKIHVTSPSNGTLNSKPTLLLKGVTGITLKHIFSIPTPNALHSVSVPLKETSFVYGDGAGQVSRDDFLLVLAKLQGIFVPASIYHNGTGEYQTSFGSASMEMVQDSQTPEGRAFDVEQCQCGKEYTGLSCERCARGHYRVNVSGDSFLGKCIPCNCNGHTKDCDPNTGKCYNCNHNTTGDHCEVCLDGFYGNATDGTSNDCKVCPCERPKTETPLCKGNYLGQPQCLNCSVGYEGRLCDSCVLGYFGEPAIAGGNCSLCQCNNNSDICHRITGYCIDCKYNTTGPQCERCENGTYGDATKQQCQSCMCDGVGAYHNVCNHRTGQCVCKPNVNGKNCSACKKYSYGFSESGCTECLCNRFGSTDLQCNETGVCECKNHTEGTKCDTCQIGFFGLPNKMCEACRCNMTGSNSSICNRTTGQCVCKPGVTGRACDRCMQQHTNFSDTGCDACPACTRLGLQKDIDGIRDRLVTVNADVEKVDGLKRLKPALEELGRNIERTRVSAENFDNRIATLQKGVNDLQSNTLNQSIHSLKQQLSSLSAEAANLQQNTSRALENVQTILNSSQEAHNLADTVNGLVQKTVNDLRALNDSAADMLANAETFARETFTSEEATAASALQAAQRIHALAATVHQNVSSQRSAVLSMQQMVLSSDQNFSTSHLEFIHTDRRISSISQVLSDVQGVVNETKHLISQAHGIVASSRKVQEEVVETLHISSNDVESARQMYENASNIMWRQNGLKARILSLEGAITGANPLIAETNRTAENTSSHATDLMDEAKKIESTFDVQKPHGARAVAAIKRYEEIVKTITKSLNTSKNANRFIEDVNARLRNVTDSYPELENRARARSDATETFLNSTFQRKIDFLGLRTNVTAAQVSFLRAVTVGLQIDTQFSVLMDKYSVLEVIAEVGTDQHSILTDSTNTITWSNMAGRNADLVISGSQALQSNVSLLEAKMQYINSSAETARSFVAQDFNFVANASKLLQNVTNSVHQAQLLRNQTAKLKTELEIKMAILQEKLRLAKEKVAKIRMALSVKGSTSVQYSASNRTKGNHLFNEIAMDFRPSSVSRGVLFHMAEYSSGLGSSLALTVVQYGSTHHVRFSYQLGESLVTITNYAVAVQTGNWFRVYATRYREKGRLTVTDMSRNFSRTMDSNTNQIIPSLQTNFNDNSPLYLAGLPEGFLPNVTDRFFDGCIDNVRVDQENLELWRPVKVEGQRSFCPKGHGPAAPDLIPGTSFYGIKTGHIKQKMGSFNITGASEITFQFRTFTKTASLFAVRGAQDYLYQVYLNNSRLVFIFKSGGQSFTLQSELSSYSDGRWYQVHIIRRLKNVTMVIRPGSGAGTTDHTAIGPFSSDTWSGSGEALYIGGVDPQLLPKPDVSDSFAGAIRQLRMSSTINNSLLTRNLNDANLTETASGVSFKGVLQEVTEGIRFIGGGYAGLETRQKVVNSLTLQFKTLEPSALLVYSDNQSAYFYIALFHGNLFVLYTVGDSSVYAPLTTSGQTLNDGAYHTLEITSHAAGISLNVDNGRIQLSPDVNTVPPGPVPLNGVFYIGGIEPSVHIPIAVPVLQSFIGGVRLIRVNRITQDVFSGRSSEVSLAGVSPELTVIPTPQPTTPPPTAPPPTCGDPNPPLVESNDPDIATFGPENSYIGFMPTREVLDYIKYMGVVTIKFRALAPNGVLFYAANDLAQPKFFISLELISGQLVYKYQGESGLLRVTTIFSNYSVGGIWYTARLLRICQFSAILIPETKDYKNTEGDGACAPLTINSPIYLGGVPDYVNKTVLESGGVGFIGAMKSAIIQSSNQTRIFYLNTDPSPSHTHRSNRTAYKKIQAQAHFSGLSQLLLYDDFMLESSFDISIKFSTTKRRGLLLVLADTRGASTRNTAVTLEQFDGQVVLIFNDEHNATTIRWTDPFIPVGGERNASFRLCDNNFHIVRVQKSEDIITLTVDKHDPVVGRLSQVNYQLRGNFYIGGVPDGEGAATHTGLSKVRLTGCVSNLSINGKEIDIMRNPVSHNVQFGCRGR